MGPRVRGAVIVLLAVATVVFADSDRRELYRKGFLRRCAVSTPAAVCECVASEAFSTREEVELKRLGFALETGALQLWLASAKKRCAEGRPAPPEGDAGPVARGPTRDSDDALGLNPWCAVSSTPPGAKVFVGEEQRGVTPLRTRVKAIQKNTVRVELEGFFPESKLVEPNANEETALAFELRPAARVRVTSEPPGATVSVGGEVVLAKTPGLTAPLPPGVTQLVLTLPGYVAVQKQLTLTTREAALEAKLVPGVKLAVSSTPAGAEVRLDGVLVGVTPLEAYGPAKGKRSVVVSKPGWSSVTRVVALKGTERIAVALADTSLADARKRLAEARSAADKASLALVRAQNEVGETPSAPAKQRLSEAEKVMDERAAQLDSAERALKELQARRTK